MSVPRLLIFILPIAVLSLVALMFTPVPRGLLAAASRGLGLGPAPPNPGRLSPDPAGLSPNAARPAAAAPSVPAAPPAAVCRNAGLLAGPSAAPAGTVTVPAGDNSGVFGNQLPGNTTYYFAAGTHYLGSGEYTQIQPGRNDTFIGAPGAVISGDNSGSAGYVQNNFAFIGSDTSITGVTIKYLTIEGFDPPGDQGAVNANSNDNWTIEHDTIKDNVPGAAVMVGSGNTIEYNCLTGNGQYAFNAYQDPSDPQSSKVTGGPQDIVLSHNEIAYNDTCNWETSSHFPITPPSGCAGAGQYNGCGCSGGGKFWQAQDVTVEDNYVHDNYSTGIWADTDNDGFKIQGNYFSGNYAEALIYEISYNARISNNVFLRNALASGAADSSFPDSAVYISESGGDSRVPNSFGYGTLDVVGNSFTDNWGGVILWENADRFCGDGSDGACTLVAPDTARMKTCPPALANPGRDQQADTPDYFSLCRWKTQNVTVADNVFDYSPSAIGPGCTAAGSCGFNGLFSQYGSTRPYTGWVVPLDISDHQDNTFRDNSYTGPWHFAGFALGDTASWSQWTSGFQAGNGSGDSFAAQDAGSSYHSGG